jgi:hypothetical protein
MAAAPSDIKYGDVLRAVEMVREGSDRGSTHPMIVDS